MTDKGGCGIPAVYRIDVGKKLGADHAFACPSHLEEILSLMLDGARGTVALVAKIPDRQGSLCEAGVE